MGRTKQAARTQREDSARSIKSEEDSKGTKRKSPEENSASKEADTLLLHLPYLFDGRRGKFAWFPVRFVDNSDVTHEVVVVSVPMLQCYFGLQTKFRMPLSTLLEFCENALPDYPVEFCDEEFQRMSLQTPFLSFQIGQDNSPECTRWYFKVVCARKFKDLIADSRKLFNRQPRRLKCDPKGVGSNYAFLGGNNSTGPIPELSGLDISFEDKKLLPALGVPCWVGLYTPMIKKFFSFTCERHVVGGIVATKPCKVKSFRETLRNRGRGLD